jgi:uncharacterized protein (DUF2147 family)
MERIRWPGLRVGLAVVTFALVAVYAPTAAAAPDASDIEGDWWTEDREAIARIYAEGGTFFGKLIWTEEADAKDDENPDPELRDRPLRGLVFLRGFRFDGDDEWEGGKVYAADDGKTYSGFMTLSGPDTLKLRGYVGFRLFGRTATWKRVEADAYPPGVVPAE